MLRHSSSSSSPSSVLICVLYVFCLIVYAQNEAQPTTEPNEARALNSIFQQWGISADQSQWNITGEVCSGAAVLASISIDDGKHNPFVKCDCADNNGTTCHITALKVYEMDIVGDMPAELWTLTYLTNLNLAHNYLTGNLSPFIGNLTRMQYLYLSVNSLSGELPKELGLLADLRSLGFGTNNFSGPLPSELANCTKLEQIYFDSSGVSGEIPLEFANLQNIVIMWGSDNDLTGRIPNFIWNWSKLATLFEGNRFEGPIPSALSSLTSLTELRISDLSNGSSSLEFLENMKSLAVLVLRNDNIADAIPSSFREYQYLTLLDLSFNNIAGRIPDSLFQLNSLTTLFLGSNNLDGPLPAQKSPSLRIIDVSYNNLVGSLPTWVNGQNLQVNLVANNFTLDLSENSGLTLRLNCLQRNFPCNRDRPIYSQFAIKCGGPQIMSSNGIVYESDTMNLDSATYYVTDTSRWGVSNVGLFTGRYSSEFTDTLFQTGRLSASSLRYYGLGLENGNYSVILQFAETAIENGRTWKSLGRRVFDIYIQGNPVLKDFDIRKEAGGVSKRAVRKNFTAQVSENYLEIHLFWAGKGTCCIPSQDTYGPSISAISAIPDFIPTVSNNPPTIEKDNDRTGVFVGVVVGVGMISCLLVFAVFVSIRRRKRQTTCDGEDLLGDARPHIFSYAELKAATEDFSPFNKLGEGGFGPVYKGKLSDGRIIAVKTLSVRSHQGNSEFATEIAIISAVQQRNLVKLYGCCIEEYNRLLVYEYLQNKSLDKALFGERSLNLDWSTRYAICLGVARGLAYLHEESRLRIVHRDVKASNILLDSDLIPKISDFGLAKLYDDKKTHISTRVAGTFGYLAPEYAMHGHLTEKADIFAFGVVALEVVSGRPNSDPSLGQEMIYLLDWAWHLYENNCTMELVDYRLSEFSEEEVKRLIGVALLCTQTSPNLRPSMSRVVAMLSGDIEVSSVTSRPKYMLHWKFDDISSFMIDDVSSRTDYYNSSTNTRMIIDAEDPHIIAKPILHETIEEDR
ncbi:probable LRR receptor-like serine/threonine-protein kinase At1g56130 isoform X2 [Jatropha curcas]|uniref:probable LRR receptor-like serine/threonine-protein kinase At1g56130 isoform X2 n=1 Tax=Jatropha curcas TaxID=180498 RepID=UPI0009D7576A|nr:probable LRR receptor-like serine/threonine-protein kinase At1g56130 isoform X2 [Jatropha curcas]